MNGFSSKYLQFKMMFICPITLQLLLDIIQPGGTILQCSPPFIYFPGKETLLISNKAVLLLTCYYGTLISGIITALVQEEPHSASDICERHG